jgi:hypothetical protein
MPGNWWEEQPDQDTGSGQYHDPYGGTAKEAMRQRGLDRLWGHDDMRQGSESWDAYHNTPDSLMNRRMVIDQQMYDTLHNRAMGVGLENTLGQRQLQSGLDRTLAMQQSQAAGARGVNVGAMARLAANAGGQSRIQTSQQSAILQQQERDAAMAAWQEVERQRANQMMHNQQIALGKHQVDVENAPPDNRGAAIAGSIFGSIGSMFG